ncbi:MAG: flavodoxin-dependent (E)-4-hydroxy-3-methylbut-2-enyl-diphosphate synthase [Firmicutes bacterium]|nr:flavodoxin-dependent (E)-4-hydroxy-3-methylbut-2-enyl-diphosphate synthase [Bacillota bacterium]
MTIPSDIIFQERAVSKAARVGGLRIGGGAPVSIQSMLSCDTLDKEKVFAQIDALEAAGCDIIRLAVENKEQTEICHEYVGYAKVPLVADIQFDYRLALLSADAGFAKIRFNPGNIGGEKNVREIVRACLANGTAIRIGVNAGSLDRELIKKYGGRTAEALAESVLSSVLILENEGFDNIVLSAKSSDIRTMVDANRIIAEKCAYPLHIGLTESGYGEAGMTASAIAVGSLLLYGIGDTIRVSLTGEPVREMAAARHILDALGLSDRCRVVSCPTCSRCKCDLLSAVEEVSAAAQGIKRKMKVAIMGCAVNGPGEAADADCGAAFGGDNAVIFKKGRIVKSVAAENAAAALIELLKNGE